VAIIQKWPRLRVTTQSQLQQAWVDAFSDRARTLKSVNPALLTLAQDLAKNTGWYYRDVLERASYGKLLYDGDERKVTTPSVAAFAPTSTVIPQNVATALPLPSQLWDNNAFRDPAFPTRIIFRAAGLYLIVANTNWTTLVGTTAHQNRIRLNGTQSLMEVDTPGTTTLPNRFSLTTIYYFHANDYIELVVQKNNINNQVRADFLAVVAITPEALIP